MSSPQRSGSSSPVLPSSSSPIRPSSPIQYANANVNDSSARRNNRRRRPVPDDDDDDEDVHPDSQGVESEEDGEELLHDGMGDDYRPIAELDRYESDGLTDEEVDDDVEARLAAEREMRRRDNLNARRGELPLALAGLDDEAGFGERPRRRRRVGTLSEAGSLLGAEDDNEPIVNLDDLRVVDASIFLLDNVRSELRRRFRTFIRDFKAEDGGIAPYIQKINSMCEDNKQSLEVAFGDLAAHLPTTAIMIMDFPEQVLPLFAEEALSVATTLFTGYDSLHSSISVRIRDLPMLESLRDLRQTNLNTLVRITGVAVRRTSVFPRLEVCHYKCSKCSETVGPFYFTDSEAPRPSRCTGCQASHSLELDMSQTIFQNYQKLTVQETPGSVPAGRIPRQKDVILLGDLIDICAPGEEIDVTGTYRHSPDQSLNRQNGFPVFSTVILANHVERRDASTTSSYLPSDEDIREILKLSKMPNIAELLINSIGPSIYGHKHIKTAIAFALFGGEAKEFENKHRLRGDINVLLLGDPGTAKSQFLKFVEKTAQRAVYTTGKGASAVGLTASVRNDPITREWTLEGGALVLADQGVCLIDEFDKMSDQDRTSIHEAMEQQSISISKAGIVCTLKARCAVIAAANPISGRYVNTLSFQEQVDLTEPILSRFDCFCIVRDIPDRTTDRLLAEFVTSSHQVSHPILQAEREAENSVVRMSQEKRREEAQALLAQGQIPQDLLRKYIAYAKKTCHPRLQNIDDRLIVDLYTDLRKKAQASGGIQITSRQIESLIRMAEAHAKMHLREFVNKADVDAAIDTMLESFLSSQKLSARSVLEPQFMKYRRVDAQRYRLLLDRLRVDAASAIRVRQALHSLDYESACATPVEFPITRFVDWAQKIGVSDLASFFASNDFVKNGFSIDTDRGLIICTF